MSVERIERAALLLPTGEPVSLPPPARHSDVIAHCMKQKIRGVLSLSQGFVTSTGRFVGRREAHRIALAAGQIIRRCGGDSDTLYSENLW